MRKTFTSENCLYWVKKEGSNVRKLSVYDSESNCFRLINNKEPTRETTLIKREEGVSYGIAFGIETTLKTR